MSLFVVSGEEKTFVSKINYYKIDLVLLMYIRIF
ncbi:MAG: hypothetical protein JWQ40_339 [Segetibacter sp.]|nr:hypothetical protein [Segetibacter sp.]